jgi:hypothetical protein
MVVMFSCKKDIVQIQILRTVSRHANLLKWFGCKLFVKEKDMKKILILASIIFLIGITGVFASENIEADINEAILELGFEPTSDISISLNNKGKLLHGLLRTEKKLTFGLHDVNVNQDHSTAQFKQNNLTVSCDIFYELDGDNLVRLVIESDACDITSSKSINKKY